MALKFLQLTILIWFIIYYTLQILIGIPNVSVEEVNRMDEKIMNGVLKGSKKEKAVRDSFRKISLKVIKLLI